jgi:phage-related baseplate assembly protein
MSSLPTDIVSILSEANPTSSEIIYLFKGLALIPKSILDLFFANLTPAAIKKLATWSEVFITTLNKVYAQDNASPDIGDADLTTDFVTAMTATQFYGHKLTQQDLSTASNAITKAMKSENFLDGVQAGITIAQTAMAFGL